MSSEKTKKNGETKESNLVTTIRRGAIAANIWRRQAASGYEYLDFSLSRSWKSQTSGKEGYSTNYFEHNAEALKEVIDEAAEFIRELQQGAEETGEERLGPRPLVLKDAA